MRVGNACVLLISVVFQHAFQTSSFISPSLIRPATLTCRMCGSTWISRATPSSGRTTRFSQIRTSGGRANLRKGTESRVSTRLSSTDIESPFATPGVSEHIDEDNDGILPLTLDNVEIVLDEMRPYLMSDGGNVRVVEIDGPVVRLELEGACGSCPSSTMTMKMGLERRLIQRIPEISEVVQSIPDGPELNEEEIEKVLDGVRPFLSVVGGSIRIESLRGMSSIQPVLTLKMTGESASLQSVRMEIIQRVQRNFMMSTLRVEFAP